MKYSLLVASIAALIVPSLAFSATASSATTPATVSTTATTAAAVTPTRQTGPQVTIDTLSGVTPSNDFVLEPGKTEVFINPGDSVEKDIYVTSQVVGTMTFKIEVEDIKGSNNPDQPVVILGPGEKGPYSGKDFISPAAQYITLSFGQRATIPIIISAPASASPGDYDSVVLVSNEPTVLNATSSFSAQGVTRVISRIGDLFFIRVNGQAKEAAQLQDFSLDGPYQLFYDHGPFTFDILFSNTGNTHLVPYGTITVRNFFGSQVAQIPVDAYYSLPNSLRTRQITWEQPFLFGRYTATLQLNRGYSNIIDTKTISFWVIPWKYLGIAFGIILLLVIIITVFLRTFEIKRK